MFNDKMKQALLAGAAATTLLLSPYAAEASGITVYCAANFTGTAKILLDRYVQLHGNASSTYSLAGGATGNLTTAIINGTGYSTGGVTYSQADLFFAANTAAIHTLVTSAPSKLTYAGFDTSTNYGWIYAEGYLELFSKSAGDVRTAGLAQVAPDYPFTPALVIAKPSSAPYGHAALQVIDATYDLPYTDGFAFPTTGSSNVVTAADIGVTFNDVFANTFSWGFVALSQIATYDAQNLALFYSSFATNHYSYNPGTDYDPILQGAVKVNGPGDTAFRDAFVRWMKSRDAQALLLQGGYTVPFPVYSN